MNSSLNAQPDGFRLPSSFGLDEETEAAAREKAWSKVIAGEDDPQAFVEWVVDDELLSEEVAERVYEFVITARREQLASWKTTPRVPLTDAFDELNALGIVARQNFSCCGNCASGEIHDERPEGRVTRGYVYFHMQDTEALLESNETYIGYGAFIDAFISKDDWNALDEESRKVMYARTVTELMVETVLPVFKKHGIEAVWDQNLGKRILLRGVEFFAPL